MFLRDSPNRVRYVGGVVAFTDFVESKINLRERTSRLSMNYRVHKICLVMYRQMGCCLKITVCGDGRDGIYTYIYIYMYVPTCLDDLTNNTFLMKSYVKFDEKRAAYR